ncbi:uncharacterized protein J3R85_016700 [Psidium guajava]|nr:uncharacterized protein J3R85_016700 [Psidium guajava]
MEAAFRHKRSKVCVADRNSGRLVSSRGGNGQFERQRNFVILASESSSESSGTSGEDLIMLDLRLRSSRKAATTSGTPMKKLLANEMMQENGSKRQSPSVIARLMGFEGLPLQQPGHKQQKRHLDGHQSGRKVEKAERSSACSSRRSSRKSSKEEEEFKDVFEVCEMSKLQPNSYLQRGTARSTATEAEMEFIRQKFVDAKRLSTDDKLQDSKEFNDALEVLDSNKDLLLKFLQQPDPLFTKHLHDLQSPQFQSHFGSMTASKVPERTRSIDSIPGRENLPRKCGRSPKIYHDKFIGKPLSSTAHNTLKSSKLEGQVHSDILPTQIVVLKPNLGKAHGATKTSLSPNSLTFSPDTRNHLECASYRNEDKDPSGNKTHFGPADMELKSKGSREIARRITRKMRNNYGPGSIYIAPVQSRGYAGDDSSSTMSLSDSAYESDTTALTSATASTNTKSVNCKNRYKHASFSAESSVSREAKKRLSERWKSTHKSQEIGEISRGSTLAEMLAIPDERARRADSGRKIVQEGFKTEFAGVDASASCVEPLGISSRDGWKDVCVNKLSRSRSLPASSAVFGSPKSQAPSDSRHRMAREMVRRDKIKTVKENFDARDGFVNRNFTSRHVERHPPRCSSGDSSDASSEYHLTQHKRRSSLKEIDQPEQSLVVSEAFGGVVHGGVANMGSKTAISLTEPSNPEHPSTKVNSAVSYPDDVQDQSINPSRGSPEPVIHLVPESESPASSKEADQPSPVSILEAPFKDDLSSGSECFESLSADLHGLRMQLQLLKLESQACTEGSMLISSDEDAGEGSIHFSEDRGLYRTGESWESSYITNVLISSGYDNSDPEMFIAKWHSPECPVNPLVFEELEKRYCEESCSKPVRKLLFDRVNSALVEIYQQLMDPHPWVHPVASKFDFKWDKDSLRDGLIRILTGQGKKGSKGVLDKLLARESPWLNLGDDIDAIGREVERLLIDDLVAEVLPM